MPEDINIAHILEYPGVSHGVNWVSHRGKGHYYIEYIVHLSDVVSVLSLWRMRSAAEGRKEGPPSHALVKWPVTDGAPPCCQSVCHSLTMTV